MIWRAEDFPGKTADRHRRKDALRRLHADGIPPIVILQHGPLQNVADGLIPTQPQRTIRRHLEQLLRPGQRLHFRSRPTLGTARRGRRRQTREIHHVAVAARQKETAQLKNRIGPTRGLHLPRDRFQRLRLSEQAHPPPRQRLHIRPMLKAPRRPAPAIVSPKIRPPAAAAIRSARPGPPIIGTRTTWPRAAVIEALPSRTRAAVPRGTVWPRTFLARPLWPGTSRARAAIVGPRATWTRAVGPRTPRRTAPVLPIKIAAPPKTTAFSARPAFPARAKPEAAAPRLPLVVRRAPPNHLAGRHFPLLQISHPVGREVQVLQLGEVDRFWIGHGRRR